MKVIGINGSSRKDGNTAILLRTIFEELNRSGIETELIELADYEMAPCRACFACRGHGNCVFGQDGFAEIFGKMTEVDGIVLGSPVYSADVSSRMKTLLDRGAAVAAVRRAGGMIAVDTMNHFFLNKEMTVAGSTYWNMVYGKETGDVRNDAEGMANMRNLAQNMAWLLQRIHA